MALHVQPQAAALYKSSYLFCTLLQDTKAKAMPGFGGIADRAECNKPTKSGTRPHHGTSSNSLTLLGLLRPLGLLLHPGPPDGQVHPEADHRDHLLGELPESPELERMAPPGGD